MLKVQNLRMYYTTLKGDVKAVDGVSFELGEGNSLGLAGESGCGKTSVALSILGLLPPNGKVVEGEILFQDQDLLKKSKKELNKIRWKEVSIVFQGAMNALNPVINVGEQITEAIVAHGTEDKSEAIARTEEILGLVGIEAKRIDNYPHQLSGGMKQRVNIAMALACEPKIVIADEPTTALDVIVQGQILTLIQELKATMNLSLLVISHDLSVINEICDNIGIMYGGKLVECSDAESFFRSPVHPYSKALLESFPDVYDSYSHRRLSGIPGVPPNLINPPPGCRFYPRCSVAEDNCRKEEPKMVEISSGRFVACSSASTRR